jgi:hypothetical protein
VGNKKFFLFHKSSSNKFHAVQTIVDGIKFHSGKEANRYLELKLLLRAGEIFDLKLQVPYEFVVNGFKICKYIADFVYFEKDGKKVVEDSKGMKTDIYRIKKKMMKAIHNIEVLET